MSHDPTKQDSKKFSKATYVLIKKESKWRLMLYFNGKDVIAGDVNRIQGLDAALEQLPSKSPEQLTQAEIVSVRNVILAFDHPRVAPLGTGNSWSITYSINSYLVAFFNTFLKEDSSPAFQKCEALSKNTYIKCGVARVPHIWD